MLLLSFLIFKSNVTIINVFNHIFVPEVILKTRIIKAKCTRTTFLNLTLPSSCNYLRGFILFDYNTSWHWTMACRNWKFQWVLPISNCKVWIKSVQYFLYDVFLLIFLCISNLSTFYIFCSFLLFSLFSPSVLELLINKIFCLKINILLYCIGSVSYTYQQISYTCMLNTISSFNVLYFVYFLHLLLFQHGDIVRNSGPQSGQIKNLSCCHWNVNSLVAQNLSKITQLEAGSFHVKCTKAGHDLSQILIKIFQIKSIYEIRLSGKFQHKLITHSKVMTPQSWHHKLKINKTRWFRQLGCSFESQ